MPLENLCLSPQCGFSSTHHGNKITVDDQRRKLGLALEVAGRRGARRSPRRPARPLEPAPRGRSADCVRSRSGSSAGLSDGLRRAGVPKVFERLMKRFTRS